MRKNSSSIHMHFFNSTNIDMDYVIKGCLKSHRELNEGITCIPELAANPETVKFRAT
jgi:hypothetical protein